MIDATLANGKVSAEVYGNAPTVLMLFHSLLADRSSFARVIAPLAERFTVVLVDLPGFGGSEPTSGSLTEVADRMAEATRSAVASFAQGQPPIVLGNGYGGFVALQMVIRHPNLAARLVLADAGAAFSEPGREAFRAMARGATAKGLEAVADTAMRRLFAADYHAANPDLVAERRARFLAMDKPVFLAACSELAGLDLTPDLPTVNLPVLVMVGEQDEATPPPMSRALAAALPNATLVELPGCAHVPQLQSPEQFLDAVLPFLTA